MALDCRELFHAERDVSMLAKLREAIELGFSCGELFGEQRKVIVRLAEQPSHSRLIVPRPENQRWPH
jgi:hypothetical protein